jgi:hypothetical protein
MSAIIALSGSFSYYYIPLKLISSVKIPLIFNTCKFGGSTTGEFGHQRCIQEPVKARHPRLSSSWRAAPRGGPGENRTKTELIRDVLRRYIEDRE